MQKKNNQEPKKRSAKKSGSIRQYRFFGRWQKLQRLLPPFLLVGRKLSQSTLPTRTLSASLNRREILGQVVGGDAHIAPWVLLNKVGAITEKYIKNIDSKSDNVYVDKYVIMLNHIHMIIALKGGAMWAV